jgi:hypothetical protein
MAAVFNILGDKDYGYIIHASNENFGRAGVLNL